MEVLKVMNGKMEREGLPKEFIKSFELKFN